MDRVRLKNTDLMISRIGIGTGTSKFSGKIVQAQLPPGALEDILLYGYERGVNFWDTASSYGTYGPIATALSKVKRHEVVICTKFMSSSYRGIVREVKEALERLGTDYIDIGLLHGVRNSFELKMRSTALEALGVMKQRGLVRYTGLSSHGLGALADCVDNPAIEIAFVRLNCSGEHMDSHQENFLSKLIAIPQVKKISRAVVPRALLPSISAYVEQGIAAPDDYTETLNLIQRLKRAGKGVIAMKVLAVGNLKDSIEKAIGYVLGNRAVASAVIGVTSRNELDEIILAYKNLYVGSTNKRSKVSGEYTCTVGR